MYFKKVIMIYRWYDYLRSIAFNLIGSLFLGLMSWWVWNGYQGTMWYFLAGIICLSIANADKIKSFRATESGLEWETREVVEEARNTLAELKQLAKTLSRTLIEIYQSTGRLGGLVQNINTKFAKEL